MNPYSEKRYDGYFVREFSNDVLQDELEWHRDSNTRKIEVLEGYGWKFQYDNQLPLTIVKGDRFEIKANTFHRLIKGPSTLKLRITEKL